MVDARYTEPLYRSHHGAMDDKTKLVESFQEFTGNTVSPESISLAKACIKRGGSKEQRYAIIHFDKYLQQNQVRASYLWAVVLIIIYSAQCWCHACSNVPHSVDC